MTGKATPDPSGSGPAPITSPGADLVDKVQPYGKYVLIRKLAEGGMAEIFLAKQPGEQGFERNVVIKRMLKHLSDEPHFVGMFLDEARLAARLIHQNIVQIHDLGQAEGCHYICMEYLPGEDFSTVLRSAGRRGQYVPLNLVVRVMADAARGLHYAHDFADEGGQALNIVHRDVSPSNIFVTYQGQVKVLDFGIARAESRSTRTTAGVVKGKYMYMAPEQAQGDPNHPVDRRADVFSLGVSLYEALTNTRPFARDNDLAILNAVLKGDFKSPRAVRTDLPVELEQIVLRAMALHPDARYPTAADLASALEQYLAARTSASGGALLAAYLKDLFGEERLAQKSRIPTLETLRAGAKAAAVSEAGAPHRSTSRELPTVAVPPPVEAQVAPARRSGLPVAAAVVGGLLLVAAGAGAVMWDRMAGPGGEAPVPVATPPVPVAAVAPGLAGADAGRTGQADAGVVGEEEIAEADVEEASEPKVKRRRPRAIKLTAAEIQKVVRTRGKGIMRCFDTYKDDLSQDRGQVTVQFSILETGRVKSATVSGSLAGTRVGSCLERNVKRLRFPRHVDRIITLALPVAYEVKR